MALWRGIDCYFFTKFCKFVVSNVFLRIEKSNPLTTQLGFLLKSFFGKTLKSLFGKKMLKNMESMSLLCPCGAESIVTFSRNFAGSLSRMSS